MSDSQIDDKYKQALDYHSSGRPGKIEIKSSKPCGTQRDLSLAYSPGVAAPCLEIHKDPSLVYKYTTKGNLVAVISNGTAVLGLGNIGPLASKPVMEGKGVLFKRFADIDVFDIEIDAPTVEEMVQVISALGPTFGGINLEDIKAPECFEVERILKEKMDIPVFHDDQHGTAIITVAAFLNAMTVTKRKAKDCTIVFSGAGAASIACAKLLMKVGADPQKMLMCDSSGVIYEGRTEGMNKYKIEFAIKTKKRTLTDAMDGADVFIGLSAKGVVNQAMIKSMAKNPIIFAMANPDPEITPEEVAQVRDDAIMATGRSDYPNQVNNVLGFPFIFRGALDVRAKKINDEMKLAAAYALSELAREDVPDDVKKAYGDQDFRFGKNYLIPKPFDKRVLSRVAPAIAKAAMETGVAQLPILDLKKYAQELEERLGTTGSFLRSLRDRLDHKKKRKILFAEGENTRVLRAVNILLEEGKVEPVLLGDPLIINEKRESLGLPEFKGVQIISPESSDLYENFVDDFYFRRQRKGITKAHAADLMTQSNYFGSMLVYKGIVDGMITGATQSYSQCVNPIFKVLEVDEKAKASGIYIVLIGKRIIFFADCTLQIDPNSEDLSQIAVHTADLYQKLMLKEPRIAFLSFSSFGSNSHPAAKKVQRAVELTRKHHPNYIVDGEFQADVAVNTELMKKYFEFSKLDQAADVLIFPDLNSSNICYKLITQLADAEVVGPLIVPMKYSINVVQRTATVNEIVSLATATALIAQEHVKEKDKVKGKK